VNNELRGPWKEAVATFSKAPPQNLLISLIPS